MRLRKKIDLSRDDIREQLKEVCMRDILKLLHALEKQSEDLERHSK